MKFSIGNQVRIDQAYRGQIKRAATSVSFGKHLNKREGHDEMQPAQSRHGRFASAPSLLMSAAVPVPPSWPSDPSDTIS
jgi:hypothetical protein